MYYEPAKKTLMFSFPFTYQLMTYTTTELTLYESASTDTLSLLKNWNIDKSEPVASEKRQRK